MFSSHGIKTYGVEDSFQWQIFPINIILDDNYYNHIAASPSVPSSSTKFDAYIDIAVPPAILPYLSKKRAVLPWSEMINYHQDTYHWRWNGVINETAR